MNECALNNGDCDQICNNTVGSFQCSCNRGYRLNLNRMTCSGRITACTQFRNVINFVLYYNTIDINECSLNIDGCDQVCNNTMGSYQCRCNRGYTLNNDERTCSGRIITSYMCDFVN